MNKGVVVRTLAAFLLAAALLTVPSTAQAQSACDPDFTLTSGGVAEADLNGDGLTCEVTGIDSVTGGLITLALDNAPADQASTTFGCPDQHRDAAGNPSSGFNPFPWDPGMEPDRNNNAIVCIKELPGFREVIIDDNVRK